MDFLSAFAPFGALAAALVAGLFSFLNMVSTKESKVSEFRQAWIDGLREEIAQYISAVDRLSLINSRFREGRIGLEDHLRYSEEVHRKAAELFSKIEMRLNPEQVHEHSDSHEAKLFAAVRLSRQLIVNEDYDKASVAARKIGTAAAPLLKEAWETVKNGEERYQTIREIGTWGIIATLIVLPFLAVMVAYGRY